MMIKNFFKNIKMRKSKNLRYNFRKKLENLTIDDTRLLVRDCLELMKNDIAGLEAAEEVIDFLKSLHKKDKKIKAKEDDE